MTIEPHPRGWKVTVDVGYDPITGRRRRVSRLVEGTKKQAGYVEAELKLEGRKGVTTKGRTVADMFAAWYANGELDWSPKTAREYRRHIDNYFTPTLGSLPVRKLTSDRIEGLYRRIRKEGKAGRPLSPNTIKRVHATMRGACHWAVRHKWLHENPALNADTGRAIRYEVEPPRVELIAKIIDQASADVAESILLAVMTGARRGELAGIQWADVDWKDSAVTFRRAVVDVDGKAVVVPHRRKSSIRTVHVDPATIDALKARRARHRKLALACGIQLQSGGYVLAEEPGQREPIRPQLIGQRWRDVAKKAGVSNVRLHDLRHWHITELLAAGVPLPNVRQRAGWASDAMVRTYGHAVGQLDRDAAEIIGARLAREDRSSGQA